MKQILKERSSMWYVAIPIAALFSALTLFIIESWIKYLLFSFEVIVIITVILLFRKEESDPRWNHAVIQIFPFHSSFVKSLPSIALIGIALILLAVLSSDTEGGLIQLALSMAAGSFLVGYVGLSIFNLSKHFTRIEFYIISLLTSIALSGFSFLVSSPGGNSDFLTCTLFLVVGLASLVVTYFTTNKKQSVDRPKSFSRSLDALAIGVCIMFYVIFIILLYPDAALLVGTDISRHFSYSEVLSRSPTLYSGPFYILFHSFQGSMFQLSGDNQPVSLFLSSFVLLNLFIPLSVYAASKRLLAVIDTRLPGLVTIFYTFLSNFSFIYFITNLFNSEQSGDEYFLFAREVAEKSYFGNINLLQPFNFVGPLTISIIVVVTLITIMKNESVPKYRYIGLISFLAASCGLIHVPEIAIFVLIFSVYSLIRAQTFPRIRETLVAMSIGLSGSAVIFLVIDAGILKVDFLQVSTMVGAFLFPIVFSILALALNQKKRFSLFFSRRSRISITIRAYAIEGSVFLLVILYLIGLTLWFFTEDLQTSPLQGIGIVPTFLLPMMIGIVGLLGIFSVRNMKNRASREVILFLLFTIFLLLVIGKIISFINVNFYHLPYWEKRIPGLIFVFTSMLAPIVVINFFDHISIKRRNSIIMNCIWVAIIGSIILSGYSSLSTQIEYWYLRAKGEQGLGIEEAAAVVELRKVVDRQYSSAIVTPSSFSRHAVAFAGPTYQYSNPDVLFSSKSPEVPLMILGGLPYDRVYVYIHNRDTDILNEYPDSWFSKHLLPFLPVLYKNGEAAIYNATGLESPMQESETAVVVPSHPVSDSWKNVYGKLSKSLRGYTEILDSDVSSFGKHSNLLFTVDPISTFSIGLDLTSRNLTENFWRTKGSWELTGDGLTAMGNYSDSSLNKNYIISDFISGNNDMTLSTLFKVDNQEVNRKTPTFASIVLSWVNQTYFDTAGVLFLDDDVHVYFADIRNSRVTLYPQFPYSAPLDTGRDRGSGDVFNLTISTAGNVEDLFINGTRYLSRATNERLPGFTGLSTSGASNITFTDLAVYSKQEHTPYDEMYRYVVNGGNLTVYNTNGYGLLFDLLSKTNLPLSYQYNMTTPGPSIEIKKARLGMGHITYVDLYQLQANTSILEMEKDPLLENITNKVSTGGPAGIDRNSREIPMTFQNIEAMGAATMNTNFIAFPNGINAKLMDVATSSDAFKPAVVGANITSLKLLGYDNVTIHSDHAELLRSGGLYSHLVLGNKTILDLDPRASLRLTTSNGSQIAYENVTSIVFDTINPLITVMRTPTVELNGNVLFADLHAARSIGIDGQNSNFKGRISFTALASDTYTLTENLSFGGTFDTSQKKYDELSTLTSNVIVFDIYSLPSIVIATLAIPFVLAGVFLFYKRIL